MSFVAPALLFPNRPLHRLSAVPDRRLHGFLLMRLDVTPHLDGHGWKEYLQGRWR
jgi:hypothetical protein